MLRWAVDPSDAVPVPDWYPVMQLARDLNLPPWALDDAPPEWLARLLYLQTLRGSVKRG